MNDDLRDESDDAYKLFELMKRNEEMLDKMLRGDWPPEEQVQLAREREQRYQDLKARYAASKKVLDALPEEEKQRRAEYFRQGALREWGEDAYLLNEYAQISRTPLDDRFPRAIAEYREKNGLPAATFLETLMLIDAGLEKLPGLWTPLQ